MNFSTFFIETGGNAEILTTSAFAIRKERKDTLLAPNSNLLL